MGLSRLGPTRAFSDGDELIVPTSRGKLVAAALGSIAFVAVGGWLLRRAPQDGIEAALAGLAAAVFFCVCGIYALWRLIRPRPALVISRQGIVDNASALSVGLLRWDEIAELYEYRYKNQVMLGIVPRNLDTLLMKQPAWKRRLLRANLWLGTAPVNIPQVILPMKVSELLREIETRFPR